jgi:hypothetical protein
MVTNLSSRKLSTAENQLLSKGQTFVIAPKTTKATDLTRGVDEFKNRVIAAACQGFKRRAKCSRKHTNRRSNRTIEISKLSENLQKLAEELDAINSTTRDCQNRPNITRQEQNALEGLKDKSIVIKPADKGSQLVVMDREDYMSECLRQLNDTNFYKPLSNPLHTFTAQMIAAILKSLLERKIITKSQFNQLTPLMNIAPDSSTLSQKSTNPNSRGQCPEFLQVGRSSRTWVANRTRSAGS